jgi:hypothetical protein
VARGWESKSVENQIEESRERVRASEAGKTPEERERETRRTSLQLARAKALQDLQVACDRRHRALLEQTIAHLDTEIEKLSK